MLSLANTFYLLQLQDDKKTHICLLVNIKEVLRSYKFTAVRVSSFVLPTLFGSKTFLPYRPEQRFEDYIPVEEKDSLEPKKQILKRSKEIVAPSGPSQKVNSTHYSILMLICGIYSWSSSRPGSPMLI